jgi:hypothetical protein
MPFLSISTYKLREMPFFVLYFSYAFFTVVADGLAETGMAVQRQARIAKRIRVVRLIVLIAKYLLIE